MRKGRGIPNTVPFPINENDCGTLPDKLMVWLFVMYCVNPCIIISIISVTMNGFSFPFTIMRLLVKPTAQPTRRAVRIPILICKVSPKPERKIIDNPRAVLHKANNEPTDRSIPPAIITYVNPIETIAITEVFLKSIRRLSCVKKAELLFTTYSDIQIRPHNKNSVQTVQKICEARILFSIFFIKSPYLYRIK